MDFDFTTETITPDNTNILTIGGSGGLEISVGTTPQRPSSPINGTIRYNTDLNIIEGFSNNSWESLIGVTNVTGTTNEINVVTTNNVATISIPHTFIAPGNIQYTENIGYSTELITPTGNNQNTATLIETTFSTISAGAVGTGVILPLLPINGELHVVVNSSNSLKYIYPALGHTIDNNLVDSPVFINPDASITFMWDGVKWVSIVDSVNPGNSGISIDYQYGNLNINNTGVITFSGGSTGLTPTSAASGSIVLGGTLGIGHGGTGSSTAQSAFNALSPLTTSGDLLYFNGTNNTRLSLGATGNVLSIVSGSPAWVTQMSLNAGSAVTATNIAGGVQGSVLYQTAANTSTWLSPGTSSQVLVSGSSPSWVSVPTALGYTPLDKNGDTMSGTLDMGANYIINALDPVNAQDVATKAYVDSIASGLDTHPTVRLASTANLDSVYDNGTAGVGATLTNSGTQEILSIDGVQVNLNDRVLVKDQTNKFENGVYLVSDTGSSSTDWVLTRVIDFDTSAVGEVTSGAYFLVLEGATYSNTGWIQTETLPVIGTDDILFSQFSSSTTYSAGAGLQLTGNQFSNTGVLTLTTNAGLSTNTSATGNVTITNTGVVALNAGTGISVSSATGSVTVSALNSTITVSSNYTVSSSILTVFADGSAGGFEVTLPSSPSANELHNIKKIDETRTNIIVNGNGNLIDKYSTITLNTPFVSIAIQWNAANSRWQII